MPQQLTYKKKFLYFRVFLIFFIFIGYEMAIKKTIELKRKLNQIEYRLSELSKAPDEITILENKLNRLNNSVKFVFDNQQSVQDLMLENITSYCKQNNVLIKDFPKANEIEKANYTIKTNYLVLEGSFEKLLMLLYNIEQKYKLGKVSSARFIKSINSKTKTPRLNMELVIQNIESHEK